MSRTSWFAVGLAYALLIAGTVWGLFAAQAWAIRTFATQTEQSNWEEWQKDTQARQDAQDVPENQRGHQAAEPPMLILLRDHFGGIMVGSLVMLTFVFAFFVFVMRGASRTPPPDTQADESRRGQPVAR